MKKRIKIFLLLGLTLILVISGCTKNSELSKKEKLEDFNKLYKVLKKIVQKVENSHTKVERIIY